jgi:hypothetical protein
MNGSRSTVTTLLTLAAGAASIVLRIVPHPANFSSVGALGLFGGAKLRSWQAFALPLGVMFVSDLALWLLTALDPLYSPLHLSRAYVYASFLIYVAIGHVLRHRESWGWIIGASLLGSLQFFVVTNFCEWLFQPLLSEELLPSQYRYSRDLSGLLVCFAAALPFLNASFPWDFHAFVMMGDPSYGLFGTLLGDLVCTCGLFGLSKLLAGAHADDAALDRPALEAVAEGKG